jgi:hypothetical protein
VKNQLHVSRERERVARARACRESASTRESERARERESERARERESESARARERESARVRERESARARERERARAKTHHPRDSMARGSQGSSGVAPEVKPGALGINNSFVALFSCRRDASAAMARCSRGKPSGNRHSWPWSLLASTGRVVVFDVSFGVRRKRKAHIIYHPSTHTHTPRISTQHYYVPVVWRPRAKHAPETTGSFRQHRSPSTYTGPIEYTLQVPYQRCPFLSSRRPSLRRFRLFPGSVLHLPRAPHPLQISAP